MTSGWIRRVAVLAVAGACTLAATGCSSTTQDAATIEFKDAGGKTQTEHVSRATLLDQVDQFQSVPDVRKKLDEGTEAGAKSGADESVPSATTASILTSDITQVIFDSAFKTMKVRVSDAMNKAATAETQQQFGEQVFDTMPKKLKSFLVDSLARKEYAVLTACPTGKLTSHILVRTEAEATDLYNQIKQGADFAKLASTKSIDTGSAKQGGLLGCLLPATYAAEFQSTAEKLPVDVVSTPVKTKFGYHLILSHAWDPDLTLTQQGAQLLQPVRDYQQQQLGKIAATLKVQVDPRFGTWKSPQAGAPPEVVPPTVAEPSGFEPTSTTTVPSPLGGVVPGG